MSSTSSTRGPARGTRLLLLTLGVSVAMLFVLAQYLQQGLAIILVYVGVKMIVSHWWHFPTVASLGVIVAIVAGAIGASIVKTRRAEAAAIGQAVDRER